jgi:hypothetical protein
MPGQFIVRVVGAIGLAVFANTPACASDVSAMSCSQIGGFARQVAEQKLKGVTLKDAVRRLRKSSGSQYADTDHELENIVRGIYRIPIFSTVSPEEVGSAYQIACEKGKSRAQITAIIYKERSPDCGVSNRPRCPDPPLGARRRAGGAPPKHRSPGHPFYRPRLLASNSLASRSYCFAIRADLRGLLEPFLRRPIGGPDPLVDGNAPCCKSVSPAPTGQCRSR